MLLKRNELNNFELCAKDAFIVYVFFEALSIILNIVQSGKAMSRASSSSAFEKLTLSLP